MCPAPAPPMPDGGAVSPLRGQLPRSPVEAHQTEDPGTRTSDASPGGVSFTLRRVGRSLNYNLSHPHIRRWRIEDVCSAGGRKSPREAPATAGKRRNSARHLSLWIDPRSICGRVFAPMICLAWWNSQASGSPHLLPSRKASKDPGDTLVLRRYPGGRSPRIGPVRCVQVYIFTHRDA